MAINVRTPEELALERARSNTSKPFVQEVYGPLTDGQLRANPIITTVDNASLAAIGDTVKPFGYPALYVENSPDSTNLDAFGRLRISTPEVLGFGAFEYGLNTAFIETSTTGTGAVANLVNESSISLSTGGTASGAKAIAQTRIHHRYVPGRSQLVRMTGSFATPAANMRQRVGYFNGRDGLFLEYDGLFLYIVRRSYVTGVAVDERIVQSSWQDPMDGTGASGLAYTFNNGTTWLFWMDLEWLGVGRYRFGFASPYTGALITAHAAAGTNTLTVPYMRTANLPARVEIENTALASVTSTMKWICYAVDTEGGNEGDIPVQVTVDSITNSSLANGTWKPILAIRANTTGPNSVPNRGHIVPKFVNAMVTSAQSCAFRVYLNPTTLTQNGGAVTWTSAGSLGQQAAFTAAGDTIAGGTILDTFFAPASATTRSTGAAEIARKLALVYTELGGVQDTLVLAGAGVGGTATAVGAITFQEKF